MKLNDQIQNIGSGKIAQIINAPKPPKKWLIKFEDGSSKLKTKSFLKKYYEVIK